MSVGVWIILIVAILAGLAVLLGVLAAVLGVGGALLYWLTALFHATKPEPPPGENDDKWSSDQASEVK